MAKTKSENLKDQIIDAAFEGIEENGIENLSMRDIARRLGVSHQAPYKHFQSRNHILAAVVARCFNNFADHLRARPKCDSPEEDLLNMGFSYLEFAQNSPLKYRLMFNTPLPPMNQHPDMLKESQIAFSLLKDRLDTMRMRELPNDVVDPIKHDALFIWSLLHGFTSLMQSDVMATVEWNAEDEQNSTTRMFKRLAAAIEP